MSRDGTFADELCIISLSKVLNKKICVFTPQHGLQEFGQLRDGDFFPKRVAHNGVNHFDTVLFRCSPLLQTPHISPFAQRISYIVI